MNKKTLNTLLAGAVAVSTLGLAGTANALPEGSEKCYGVVKAGQNGCGSADKAHGCAGQATVDASGVEWVAVPTGTCDKLANGSTTPVFAADAATDAVEGMADKAMDHAHDAKDHAKDKVMDEAKGMMKKAH